MASNRTVVLKRIATAAVEAEKRTGCPAELSTAQCILESGWLAHAPRNNCFGIKDTDRYPGSQYLMTKGRAWKTERAAFEVYDSLEDCFEDHAKLITGGFGEKPNAYAPAFRQYQLTKNLEDFITEIAPIYAEDSEYESKIMELIRHPTVIDAIKQAREQHG